VLSTLNFLQQRPGSTPRLQPSAELFPSPLFTSIPAVKGIFIKKRKFPENHAIIVDPFTQILPESERKRSSPVPAIHEPDSKGHIMRMSKCVSALILTVLIGVILSKQAFAGAAPLTANLTLTENSPTSLSLTYNGPDAQPGLFTVLNTGPDLWTITVSQTLGPVTFLDFSNGWLEPESNLFVNEVTHSTTMNPTEIFVHSDLSILFNTSVTADNTGIVVGLDSGVPITLTFHDIAQSAETSQGVPEGGTTLGMFVLTLSAFVGLRRVIGVHFA
jgi:hypothetical protein